MTDWLLQASRKVLAMDYSQEAGIDSVCELHSSDQRQPTVFKSNLMVKMISISKTLL